MNLQNLLERVKDGDGVAADRFQRVLRPVLAEAVRRVLQTEDYATPLGRRVHDLLDEAGIAASAVASCLDSTTRTITQALCGQTVARLQTTAAPRAAAAWHARETVLA
jgi:hypothetical protein